MTIGFDFINGLAFGLEYMNIKDMEPDDPTENMVVIHVAFIRITLVY